MITDEQLKDIVKHIKENKIRLDKCSLHSFTIPIPKPYNSNIIDKYKCKNCGGVVSYREKIFYEKGLEHGRKEQPTK